MTALKTLSLRLRSTKKEMEEAGEDTDGMTESVTALQSQLLKLTHGKVDIMKNGNEFKNTTEMIREMSAAWSEMSDIERAEALEAMGGKNHANTLAAMITNFDIAESAIETSANATGSALRENEVYLDSIQGRVEQFNNALQTMWSTELDSGLVKVFIDLGTSLVTVVDKLGLVNTLVMGLATYFSVFKKNKFDFASLLGIHDIEKGWTLGKEGASKWVVDKAKAAKSATIDKIVPYASSKIQPVTSWATSKISPVIDKVKQSSKAQSLIGGKTAFENAVRENIQNYVDIDTRAIDTQIDSVTRKLEAARKSQKAAMEADRDYYKNLGSKAPSHDRDVRRAETEAEVKRLEQEQARLFQKRESQMTSAADKYMEQVYRGVDTSEIDGKIADLKEYKQATEKIVANQSVDGTLHSDYYKSATKEISKTEKAIQKLEKQKSKMLSKAEDNYLKSTFGSPDDINATASAMDKLSASTQSMTDNMSKHAGTDFLNIFEKGLGQGKKALDVDFDQLSGELKKLEGMDGAGIRSYMANLGQLGDISDDTKTALAGYAATVTDGTYSIQGAQQYVNQYNASLQKLDKSAIRAQAAQNLLNAGISLLATVGVAALTALIDKLVNTQDKFDSLASELSTVTSDLQNLESEMSNIDSQIAELNSKGALTFAEQEELGRLKEQSAELERQISLKEKLQNQKQLQMNQEAPKAAENYYKKTGVDSGKTTGERAGDGAKIGATVGGIAAGAGAGAAIGSIIPVVGTAVGTLIGSLIAVLGGAAIGAGVGAIMGATEEKVGDSIDNMQEKYSELQQKYADAQSKYESSLDDDDYEDVQKAYEQLIEFEGNMAEHLSGLQAYYDQMDWETATVEQKKAMQDFYDTQDKWAIASGSKDAKVNAIDRMFGPKADKKIQNVKKALEEMAATGEEIDLEKAFNTAGLGTADINAFTARLYEMGLTAQEVEESFKQMAAETSNALSTDFYDSSKEVGGVKSGVESISEAFKTAQKEGYLTADALDGIAETLGGAEDLGNVWTEFAEVMSNNTSTLKEQREAAEALAEAYLDDRLMKGGHLSASEQNVIATQLRDMGIGNAREYVRDRDMENMYQEIWNVADYDWKKVEDEWNNIQTNWEDGSNKTVQAVKEAGIKEKKAWEDLTIDEQNAIAEIGNEFKKLTKFDVERIAGEYGYDIPVRVKLDGNTPQEIKDELTKLEKDGNVDLTIRPKVDADAMKGAGWDKFSKDFTNLYAHTYANDEGTIAMNFTPILPDGSVMTPEELKTYAQGVIAGAEDNLNLKIGTTFEGENAMPDALKTAKRIEEISSQYLNTDHSSQYIADLMNKLSKQEKKYKEIQTAEGKIGGIKEQDKVLAEYEKAYKSMSDKYGQREWFNAIDQDMSAEDVWSQAFEITADDTKKNASKKNDFIDAYNGLKSLGQKVKADFNLDSSSLKEIDAKKQDLNKQIDELEAELKIETSEQSKAEIEADIEDLKNKIESLTSEVNIEFSYDINQVKSDIEATQTAINESLSNGGMSEESVKNIRAIYGELDDYDESTIFESTANGIQANIDALQKLEYQKQKIEKDKTAQKLQEAREQYDLYTEAIKNSTSAQEMNEHFATRAGWEEEIKALSMLEAQYNGVTSAHNRWVAAQAGPTYGSRMDEIKGMFEQSDTMHTNKDYGETSYKRATQYLTGLDDEEIEAMSTDELAAAYQKARSETKKYFTDDTSGAANILKDFQKIGALTEAVNAEGEEGFQINMSTADIAEELGRSEAMIDDFYNELRSKGVEIFEPGLFEDLQKFSVDIEEARDKVQALSGEKVELEFTAKNKDKIDDEIKKTKKILKDFQKDADKKGVSIGDIEGATEAQQVLEYLALMKVELNKPAILDVQTTGLDVAEQEVLTLMRNVSTASQTVQVKTEIHGPGSKEVSDAQAELDAAVAQLKAHTQGETIIKQLGLQEDPTVDEVVSKINSLNSEQVTATVSAVVNGTPEVLGLGDSIKIVEDKEVIVLADVYGTDKVNALSTAIKNLPPKKTTTIVTEYKTIHTNGDNENPPILGFGTARGTAFASGTAFAGGNWGASHSGTALGGELGQEIIVRDGRWFTIGDHGAEFFKYKKDDIIFNAEQSKQILEKGKITAGNRRGKALAEGTAFASGFIPKNLFNSIVSPSSSTSTSSKSDSYTPKSSSNGSDISDFSEKIDKLRKKYQNEISDLEGEKTRLENEIEYLETRGMAVSSDLYQNQIQVIRDSLAVKEREKAELEGQLATVTAYSDKWYEVKNAIWETTHAIQEYNIEIENIRQASAQRGVDDIIESHKMTDLENQAEFTEGIIDYLKEADKGISKDYYNKLIQNEEAKFQELTAQREGLNALLGQYTEGTPEWYIVADALWEVELALQETTARTLEWNKAIIDLYTDVFDKIGDAYDSKIDISDDMLSSMDSYAELLDLRGGTATKGLFDAMNAEYDTQLATRWEQFNEQHKVIEDLVAQRDRYDVNSDAWVYYNQQIAEAYDKLRDTKEEIRGIEIEQEKKKDEFKELATQRWDDVKEAYDNRDTYYQNQIDLNDKYIEKLEALGMDIPKSVYRAQIDSLSEASASKKAQYLQARKEMLDYEGIYGADSQEYIDKYNETIELHHEYLDYENQILEKQQQIFDDSIERFDQMIERINNVTQKMQNISGLFDDADVATESGTWTKEGLAQLGMAHQQMEYYKQTIDEVTTKMQDVDKAFKRGEISEQKYYETMQALSDQQWEAINSYEDMKDSIVDLSEARIDMIEEGIDKEIEAYGELIDLKKKELDAERELYDFKNGIEDQTKNIGDLERRIASMSGSTDAATIAERTKLEKELRDARKSLDDSYRSHAYDSMSTALDEELDTYSKNSEDYIESLRELLKDPELLIEETLEAVLEKSDTVLSAITSKASEYGFEFEEYLSAPWEKATSKSLNFKLYASQHIGEIYDNVYKSSGKLEDALSGPYTALSTDDEGNPLYQYSWYAKEYGIDKVIQYAEANQDLMKAKLSGGFEEAKSSIQGWGSEAETAVDNVIKKFTDPQTGLLAALKSTTEAADATGKAISKIPSYYAAKPSNDSGNNVTPSAETPSTPASTPSGSGPYSGAWSQLVWDLQKVIVTAFGHPVGKNRTTGKYSYSPDGYWGSITEDSLKKVQSELGVSQSGRFDNETRTALSTFLTNQYNNGSNTKAYETALKYLPKKAFAKGSLGTTKNQWALDSEPWLGDEIVLVPTASGNISYMRKGSAIMPADISANLVEWGKLNPNTMSIGDMSGGIQMMSNYVSKPELNVSFDSLVHVDHCDEGTLKDLEKMVDTKINQFSKQMNYAISKYK